MPPSDPVSKGREGTGGDRSGNLEEDRDHVAQFGRAGQGPGPDRIAHGDGEVVVAQGDRPLRRVADDAQAIEEGRVGAE